ncbi:helix-turn-helix domain-containing protein [Nocardioides pyridinolyticus]
MSAQTNDLRVLMYVLDALRRQEQRHRLSHWQVPAGVADLLAELGFRVSRGQVGSPHAPSAQTSDGGPETRLLVRYETAAQMLDVSVSTVKRLIKEQVLHPVRIGGSSRIRVAELDEYVARLAGGESA